MLICAVPVIYCNSSVLPHLCILWEGGVILMCTVHVAMYCNSSVLPHLCRMTGGLGLELPALCMLTWKVWVLGVKRYAPRFLDRGARMFTMFSDCRTRSGCAAVTPDGAGGRDGTAILTVTSILGKAVMAKYFSYGEIYS